MHTAPVHGLLLSAGASTRCIPPRLHPADARTLKAINDLVVQVGGRLELETAKKLAVDTTVVQPHSSSDDNTLLWDVVRVVTRLVGRLAKAMERRRIKVLRSHAHARRRMLAIQRMTRRQRHHSRVENTATHRIARRSSKRTNGAPGRPAKRALKI